MYYLLSLLSAFDGFSFVGLSLILTVFVASAFFKWIRSLSSEISWKKMVLINVVSILSYVASAVLAYSWGIFQGYMSLVMAALDQAYSDGGTTIKTIAIIIFTAFLPFLMNFLLWGSVVILWMFYRNKKTDKKKDMSSFKAIGIGFLSLIITPLLAIAIIVGCVRLIQSCTDAVFNDFNHFNAHIKSLCVERGDKSECPKNEAELKAFDPEGYAKIEQCTRPDYIFDSETNTATWRVFTPDGGALISDEKFYPGFGYLHRHAETEE